MLTKEAAKIDVSLIYDMFDDPQGMLEVCQRTDSSGMNLHQAIIPHLKNYGINAEGRQMMFSAAAGSINYDCVTPDSDLDVKAVYLPSVRDLYFGRDIKFSFVTDDFDCELHSAVNFRKHVLKGNMNFFETVLTDVQCVNPLMEGVLADLAMLVEMNVSRTVLATYFTACNMRERMEYSDLHMDTPTTVSKKLSHGIRLWIFLLTLLETGEFRLAPSGADQMLIKDLKMGRVDYNEYLELFDQMQEKVKSLAFKSIDRKGNIELSDSVLDLDGTDTAEWDLLNREVDEAIIKEIK